MSAIQTKAISLFFSFLLITSVFGGFIAFSSSTAQAGHGGRIGQFLNGNNDDVSDVFHDDSENITVAQGGWGFHVLNENVNKKSWHKMHDGGIKQIAYDEENNTVYGIPIDASSSGDKIVIGVTINGTEVLNKSVHTNYNEIAYDSDDHRLILADDKTISVYKTDGTFVKNVTVSENISAFLYKNDTVFVGSSSDVVRAISISDGSVKYKFSTVNTSQSIAYDHDRKIVHVSDSDKYLTSYDVENGTVIHQQQNTWAEGSLSYMDKLNMLFVANSTGYVSAVYSSNQTQKFSFQLPSDKFVNSYSYESDRKALWMGQQAGYTTAWDVSGHSYPADVDSSGSSGNVVDGTVVDQNGEPVSNASVVAWAVNYDAINMSNYPNASTKREAAQQLLEDASSPAPTNWSRQFSVESTFEGTEYTYVAVHTESDWTKQSWVPSHQNADLSTPIIVHKNPSEPLVFSVWDAGVGNIAQDEVDEDLPGATISQSENVTITQIGPRGSAVDNITLETRKYFDTGVYGVGGKTHYAVVTRLPKGFYRVEHSSAEGPTKSYIVAVGQPKEMVESFADKLETQANVKSEQAEWIESLQNDNKIQKVSTTTNARGEFNFTVASNMKTVAITAHSGGELVSDPKNATLADIRAQWEEMNNSTQSIYMSTEPTTVDPPASNVTVRVRELESPSFASLADVLSNWDFLKDLLDRKTFNRLQGIAQQSVTQLNESGQKALNKSMQELVRENQALRDKYERLKKRYKNRTGQDSLSRSEVISLAERAVETTSPSYTFEPNISTTIETPESWDKQELNGSESPALVDAKIPFGGDISSPEPSSVVVTARHSDGSVHTLNESQYSIDSSALGNGAVVITDYKLPPSVNAVSFSVMVAGSEGVGETTARVSNPHPSVADVPSIQSIDVNTISPQVGNNITVSVDSEASNYAGLQSVQVFLPNGSRVNATEINSGTFSYETATVGRHVVEFHMKTTSGAVVTETMQVAVSENSIKYPPNVRVASGQTGVFAIAGDSVTQADVQMRDGKAKIGMRLKDTSTGRVNVYASEAVNGKKDLTVRLLTETGQQINSHRSVALYIGQLSDGALIYRNGKPVSEGLRYGSINTSANGTVIHTYTNENGAVNIRVNNNPSFIEKQLYEVNVFLRSYGLDSVAGFEFTIVPLDSASGLSFAVIGGDMV